MTVPINYPIQGLATSIGKEAKAIGKAIHEQLEAAGFTVELSSTPVFNALHDAWMSNVVAEPKTRPAPKTKWLLATEKDLAACGLERVPEDLVSYVESLGVGRRYDTQVVHRPKQRLGYEPELWATAVELERARTLRAIDPPTGAWFEGTLVDYKTLSKYKPLNPWQPNVPKDDGAYTIGSVPTGRWVSKPFPDIHQIPREADPKDVNEDLQKKLDVFPTWDVGGLVHDYDYRVADAGTTLKGHFDKFTAAALTEDDDLE